MNIHQLRCAVTVARLGSQTRAAEALYMSQPNLSKALKELEQACGFRIFTRTGAGMIPTRRGEELLSRARSILEQLDLMDALYHPAAHDTASLKVAVCGAGYLSRAMALLLDEIPPQKGVEAVMREGSMEQVVRAVLSREAGVGVIRYHTHRQNRVLADLAEQGLHYILYWSYRPSVVLSRRHPLAREKRLEKGRLASYLEIVQESEPQAAGADGQEILLQPKRQVQLCDRGTALELIARSQTAYGWTAPLPEELLNLYGLVQLCCEDADADWQDALIYLKGYTMSRWEQAFYDLARREAERAGRA